MKKVLRRVIFAGTMLVLASAVAGAAASERRAAHYNSQVVRPTVRQHPTGQTNGRLVIATRVTSAFRACYANREVTLYRENGSVDRPMGSRMTDNGGRVVFNDYGPQAFYYARAEKKVGYSYVCPSRRSVVVSAF